MNIQNEIDFIAAHNGGIQMFSGDSVVGWGDTASMIAYVIKTKGIASNAFHSSSMDFADEEGFENHNDAWELWEAGMELV
tara:strand:- start:776 stop:1015 length:240 start_codon:yes stop_codon:yes gene_type:complete